MIKIKETTGKLRFCIDMQKVNDARIKDTYPYMRINGILEKLRCAKYIAVLWTCIEGNMAGAAEVREPAHNHLHCAGSGSVPVQSHALRAALGRSNVPAPSRPCDRAGDGAESVCVPHDQYATHSRSSTSRC